MSDDDLDGRYIHRRNDKRPSGTRTMSVTINGEAQEWVHVDDFMDVQRERDDYRRAIALINAWRWSPDFVNRRFVMLDSQLAGVGMTMKDGRAMNSIIVNVLSPEGKALDGG